METEDKNLLLDNKAPTNTLQPHMHSLEASKEQYLNELPMTHHLEMLVDDFDDTEERWS